MNIDNLPQAPLTDKHISPTWRQWFSNLTANLKLIPEDVVSLKITDDFSSLDLKKLNRKLVLDTSAHKLYFVSNEVKYEIKLA
jgi:hypothetical protein